MFCWFGELNSVRSPKKIDTFSTFKNTDTTCVFWHVKFIVKTECFDATDSDILHILVKTVYFERFWHVCVITPQQNCRLGCKSLKNIVFLKAALMEHAFLHVFDKLEAQPQPQSHSHRYTGAATDSHRHAGATATGTQQPQPQAHRSHSHSHGATATDTQEQPQIAKHTRER